MCQCQKCKDEQQMELLPAFEMLLSGESNYQYRTAEINNEYNYRQAEFNNELEIVGTTDTRTKISDTTVTPFRYICQIVTQTADGSSWVGSGFFIGPRTILTAGHVIWDEGANSKVPNGKISISPARKGTSKPFGTINPVNVITSYAGFSASDYTTQNDYAIIHVGTDYSNTIGYFGKGKWAKDTLGSSILSTGTLPLPINQMKVNVCGYPGDKGGDLQYSSYNKTFNFIDSGTVITYLVDTKGGQSGGPVWVKRDASLGGRVIVGIHMARGPWANSPTGTVDYNKAVFINNKVLTFIKANLK